MLNSLETLNNTSVVASDGDIGKIENFLFDDESWTIRYLVVNVGGWLNRRCVVIPLTAAEPPVWTEKSIRVRLSKEQVRHSPDIDTKKPVSRQQEIAMTEYFGLPPYWGGGELPPFSLPTGMEYPLQSKEDLHLRGAWDIVGYEVWAERSGIGRLEGFIVDDASWHLGYLDVKAGDWLHSRSLLVPTGWVESVSWADHRVILKHAIEKEFRTPNVVKNVRS